MTHQLMWMLRLAVTGGILWLLFSRIPLADVVTALTAANLGLVAFGILIQTLMRYAGARRVKLLTDAQGMSLSVRQLFEISCVSTFYGMALGGSWAGGAIRWYRLSQPDQKRAQSVVVIAFDRFMDTLALVICGLAFSVLDVRSTAGNTVVPTLLIVLSGLLMGYVLVFNKRVSTWCWKRLTTTALLPPIVRSKLQKVLDAAIRYHELPACSLFAVIGLSFARQLLGVVSLYCFALALGLPLTFMNVGWIRSLILLVILLPISVGGLGIREAGLVLLLQPYGVAPTDAVAWSFLLFSRILFFVVVGGCFELLRVVVSRTPLRQTASSVMRGSP